MSQVQTYRNPEGYRDSATRIYATPEGLPWRPSYQVAWRRHDWGTPVGHFNQLACEHRSTWLTEGRLQWTRYSIPEFSLSRHAALLLLQGVALSDLLIPGHFVHTSGQPPFGPLAHLLLRVDPWEAWQPLPRLTGLILARLDAIPTGLTPQAVLGTLAGASK